MELRILTLVFADTKAPVTKAIVKQLPVAYQAERDWQLRGTVAVEFSNEIGDEWALFDTPRGVVRMTRSNYVNSGYPRHFGEFRDAQRIILTK